MSPKNFCCCWFWLQRFLVCTFFLLNLLCSALGWVLVLEDLPCWVTQCFLFWRNNNNVHQNSTWYMSKGVGEARYCEGIGGKSDRSNELLVHEVLNSSLLWTAGKLAVGECPWKHHLSLVSGSSFLGCMAARVCLFYPTASINVNFPAGIALFAFTVKTELTILVMLLKNICHVKKSCCL